MYEYFLVCMFLVNVSISKEYNSSYTIKYIYIYILLTKNLLTKKKTIELNLLSGVAAILTYPLPDIEMEDEEEQEVDQN